MQPVEQELGHFSGHCNWFCFIYITHCSIFAHSVPMQQKQGQTREPGLQAAWFLPALPLTSHMTLGMSLPLPGLHFPGLPVGTVHTNPQL